MDRYARPEGWMLGRICRECGDEIHAEQPVLVDVDGDVDSDGHVSRSVRIRHEACPEAAAETRPAAINEWGRDR